MGFRDELRETPLLYPIGLDFKADAVQFIKLTAEGYEAAGFLDRRMITPGMPTAWGQWKPVAEAAHGLPERCHFIFHISHVGSTLLARLLGGHPELFSLREPIVLRAFADAQLQLGTAECPWSPAEFEKRLGIFMGLWSRTYDPSRRSIIKATSFVSEMAEMLLARQSDARAILMYMAPRVFLQALLGGAMVDIDSRAESRLMRLKRRIPSADWSVAAMSPGERVAMSWLSEMMSLDAAALRFADRIYWLDFDRFLAASEAQFQATLQHLGVNADRGVAASILAGPAMHRYSKATQFEFDANSRATILRESQEKHAAEVAKGEEWLERAAASCPQVRSLLDRTGAISAGA